ncbi:MAG: glycosyl hydrolase 53 family protein [Muribaculaceae bacterium]
MKKYLISALLLCAAPILTAQEFVRGADLSWATEMEADGQVFYDADGAAVEPFALMKSVGMNAVRLRVWVNPTAFGYGAWCDKADVLAKAKSAHSQGLDIMIDFHYSDFFADPGRQSVPVDWVDYSREQVLAAVADYTVEVLTALKDEGIEPRWVQVGNETNSGLCWDFGKIDWSLAGAARFVNYAEVSNAGYDAVKSVFPEAQVIVHLAGADAPQWFFGDFIAAGGKVDVIGISHYPTEDQWNSTATDATYSNVYAEAQVKQVIADFDRPVMVCETGFSVYNPDLGYEVMTDLFARLTPIDRCLGIFYWEPLTDGNWRPAYYESLGWNAYDKGAFTTTGQPAKTLDAFADPAGGISPTLADPAAAPTYIDLLGRPTTTPHPGTIYIRLQQGDHHLIRY